MNKTINKQSISPLPDTDKYILNYFMRFGDFKSVASIRTTCKRLHKAAEDCSETLFKMALKDRLCENYIISYAIEMCKPYMLQNPDYTSRIWGFVPIVPLTDRQSLLQGSDPSRHDNIKKILRWLDILIKKEFANISSQEIKNLGLVLTLLEGIDNQDLAEMGIYLNPNEGLTIQRKLLQQLLILVSSIKNRTLLANIVDTIKSNNHYSSILANNIRAKTGDKKYILQEIIKHKPSSLYIREIIFLVILGLAIHYGLLS